MLKELLLKNAGPLGEMDRDEVVRITQLSEAKLITEIKAFALSRIGEFDAGIMGHNKAIAELKTLKTKYIDLRHNRVLGPGLCQGLFLA